MDLKVIRKFRAIVSFILQLQCNGKLFLLKTAARIKDLICYSFSDSMSSQFQKNLRGKKESKRNKKK